MARAGGLGELYGLSLRHWASGQGEAPIQSLVQLHSCGLQGPQPPPFCRSSFVWLVPSPTDEWSRLAGFPASLSCNRGQGPRGSEKGKTEAGRGGGEDGKTQRDPGTGRVTEAANRDRCSSTEKNSTGEGAATEGGGDWWHRGIPTPCSPGGVNKSN